MKMKTFLAISASVFCLGMCNQALAWGDTGHRIIGAEAIRALPSDVPGFLRTPQAIDAVTELSREPDRWRGAGRVHDHDRDPAHFIDLDDEGKTFAGLKLEELPATRSDFDAATRVKGFEPFKSGYLYYSTIDAYQQVVKDLAYWRVLNYLSETETDPEKKAWYRTDLVRREALILRDIGILSHYVGDATQPMHMSIHYNGWGDFANVNGYTKERIHVPLEGPYVRSVVTAETVRAGMPAYEACSLKIEQCVQKRLTRNWQEIIPLYELEKAGGFKEGDARGKAYMTKLVARGAADLRDCLMEAWAASKTQGVGYPAKSFEDITSGKVADPYTLLRGDG